MDQRYLNSTATELATMDRVCIICREEMVAVPGNAPPMKLLVLLLCCWCCWCRQAVSLIALTPTLQNDFLWPCISFRCLRSWLERQQACPTCRQSVMDIPAQAPVQPAIVNPVAAVNPIVANAMIMCHSQLELYIHTSIHKHCLLQMHPGGRNPVP
ncbi:hypothetical protein BASA81_017747 [Batrachochytrium salamandrivorans]|nr:hypothetical protein BASA81_017747 [Batrachochytrium salamandrivorans]